MGENLALNIESRGFKIAVYNRTTSKVDDLLAGRAKGKNFVGCHSLEELVGSLAAPRKVMLMVKAGPAVDEFIEKLIPLLQPGDVIIDGGNTLFSDTERRTKYVESKGLLYIGTGVSGGEEGALKGPSMMPGGSEAAWPLVKPIFQAISAKVGPERRHPLLRMGRPARGGPLRQNGPQRHRVRRHAVDLRGLLDAQDGRRTHERRTVRRVSEVARGRVEQLPDRDHPRHLQRQGPGDRRLSGGYDPRHGRGEGDRQVDEPVGARLGRAEHAGDGGRLRPVPVGDEGRAGAGEQGAAGPDGASSAATG